MNGATPLVVVLMALLVLAGGCATARVAEPPSAPNAPPAAAAPVPAGRPTGPMPVGDSARASLDEGRKRLAQGDMIGASALLREALRLQPDLGEARASLGLTLYAMGDLDAAVDELRGLLRVRPDLESALAARPDLVQASYTLGVVRYAQGDLTGAIDAYRHVLAREPRAQD